MNYNESPTDNIANTSAERAHSRAKRRAGLIAASLLVSLGAGVVTVPYASDLARETTVTVRDGIDDLSGDRLPDSSRRAAEKAAAATGPALFEQMQDGSVQQYNGELTPAQIAQIDKLNEQINRSLYE